MKFTTEQSISFCVGKKCPDRKESNADRIRSMTDEELAEYILHLEACPPPYYKGCKCQQTECKECWLNWLKQEVEVE